MGLGSFLFSTVVSVGVGVAVTALAVGTGPLGLAAVLTAKGVEAGIAVNAVASGIVAAGCTKAVLNNMGNSGRRLNLTSSRKSGGSSNTNNQNNNSGRRSKDTNSGGTAGDPNDPYRDPNKKDSSDSSEESEDSTDQEEDDWDSSDERDERNHRYKYIAKRYPGRSTYAKPLEIDHTIPMAVWKMLLKEIKKYAGKDLPRHLKRALNIFIIILKNKDIFSLSEKDLDKLMKEFPAIEILKVVHRNQFTTRNNELRKDFNNLILDFILDGKWDKAIEYIFRDQYQIARFFINVDQEEIENILNRQRSFVKYLARKGILTVEEARNLLDVINNLDN